ncbi:hypothetical protein [Altererythrobacter sp. Z27]|uniref:hypothetical protein n=1 Tax=Altererythrobacter sp. Z27 TaxID=3461147 RepID=UPI004044C1F6
MRYRPRSITHPAKIAALLLLTAGCSSAPPLAGDDKAQPASIQPNATVAKTAPPMRTPQDSAPTTESDRLILQQIKSACKIGNAERFVNAFVASAAVRRQYLAPEVLYSGPGASGQVRLLAADYDRFPIEMFDYYWRPVQPRSADEYVEIVMEQSQDDRIAIEWTRVRYDGHAGEGDGLGTPFTLDGKPYQPGGPYSDGMLLFEPAKGCWRLIEDIRYAASSAP